MIRAAPGHLQTHDASLDLTGDNRFPINNEQSTGNQINVFKIMMWTEGKIWCEQRKEQIDERKDQMECLLPVTFRTVLRSVIVCRIRIHGFTAPREAASRGYRGLDLALN